ncbi:MAG: hypothetical protein GXO87_13665 [Chlorobi bacterium]|nr:hypothetical protein [Chlorobiota bacterium]
MSEKLLARYIYLFSILFALGALIFFPKWLVDDAYIMFRYSENLAFHSQLTWNLNVDPIEGYTGFALPIMVAAAMKMGVSPITAVHSIGVLSYIIGGIFLFLFIKKMNVSEFVRSIVILLYAVTPVMYTHIFSGLETMLFTAAIIFVSYYSFNLLTSNPAGNVQLILWSISLLFISLIRPEGFLFALLISFFSFLYFFSAKKVHLKKFFVALGAGFLIPFAIYFLWRWDYYGQLLPNTFYLKTGAFTFSYKSFHSFMEFLANFLGIPFLIAAVLLLSNLDKIWNKLKSGNFAPLSIEFLYVFLPLILFSFIITFTYFFSDLLMNYSNRFFIPVFPALLLTLALALELGIQHFKEFSKSAPLTVKAYIILVLILTFFQFKVIVSQFERQTNISFKLKVLLEDIHIRAGKYIFDHYDKNSTLLVHADAGAIPYFSKVKTVIDFGGLNDETLSHKGKMNDLQKVEYFFKTDADILVMTSLNKRKLERPETSLNGNTVAMIVKDKRFKKYTFVKKFSSPFWNYYEFLYVKNELAKKER